LGAQFVDETALHKPGSVLLHDLLCLWVIGLALRENVVQTSGIDGGLILGDLKS
jgi:hypothetical protein